MLTENIVLRVKQDNCFDFLRYLFAISLIIAHFCTLVEIPQFWFITGSMRVKAFFTITGFLVTYSFLRRNNDIRSYAIKRFVRIIPAYVVCIMFCLLLGWMVTSMTTEDFFSSSRTWKYLLANILMLNWLEPELPCTFQSNYMPVMNGSLWSMKQEVIFYIIVPMLIWVMRKTKMRSVMCGLILVACILSHNYVNVQTQYFMYFLTGMVLLLNFDVFWRWQRMLLPLSLLLLIPVYVADIPTVSDICNAIEPVCFPIVLVCVAYNLKPLNIIRKYDNITYGLYLYHFPIIQMLILCGLPDYSLTICFLVTLIITATLGCVSWFLIEKPLMNKAG